MALETTAADGVRYSGVETKGMRRIGCSLLLPKYPMVSCASMVLKPAKVSFKIDQGPQVEVDFPGAKFILLTVQDSGLRPLGIKLLAVAGRCTYTDVCHEDFKTTMRTKEQSKAAGLVRNSESKWPDVEGLGVCPVCATRIQPGKKKEYYMLIHTIMQQAAASPGTGPGILGTRQQCQLCCVSCFEGLVKDRHLADSDMSVMDAIRKMPGMPLFVGANLQGYNKEGTQILSASDLDIKWQMKGAFEALTLAIEGMLASFFGRPDKIADANAKSCLTCKTSLPKTKPPTCSRCKTATYCSRVCQKSDWRRHKLVDCVEKAVKPEVHLTASLEAQP